MTGLSSADRKGQIKTLLTLTVTLKPQKLASVFTKHTMHPPTAIRLTPLWCHLCDSLLAVLLIGGQLPVLIAWQHCSTVYNLLSLCEHGDSSICGCSHNPTTRFWSPSMTMVCPESLPHCAGSLQCLPEEMATCRLWPVCLWRATNDVSHRRFLSSDKAGWWPVQAALCRWWCCCVECGWLTMLAHNRMHMSRTTLPTYNNFPHYVVYPPLRIDFLHFPIRILPYTLHSCL